MGQGIKGTQHRICMILVFIFPNPQNYMKSKQTPYIMPYVVLSQCEHIVDYHDETLIDVVHIYPLCKRDLIHCSNISTME